MSHRPWGNEWSCWVCWLVSWQSHLMRAAPSLCQWVCGCSGARGRLPPETGWCPSRGQSWQRDPGPQGLDEPPQPLSLPSHMFKQRTDVCDVSGPHGQRVHSGILHTSSLPSAFYNQGYNHQRQSLWQLVRAKVNSCIDKWPQPQKSFH